MKKLLALLLSAALLVSMFAIVTSANTAENVALSATITILNDSNAAADVARGYDASLNDGVSDVARETAPGKSAEGNDTAVSASPATWNAFFFNPGTEDDNLESARTGYIVVTLDKAYNLSSASMFVALENAPGKVTVQTSADGSTFSDAVELTDGTAGTNGKWITASLSAEGVTVVKYAVSVADGQWDFWAFFNEVEIMGSTGAASAPSDEPSSEEPSSEAPSSEEPSSEAPSSEAPSSEAPSSEAPSSEAPSSEAPSSEAPSSEAPSSEAPSSDASSNGGAATLVEGLLVNKNTSYKVVDKDGKDLKVSRGYSGNLVDGLIYSGEDVVSHMVNPSTGVTNCNDGKWFGLFRNSGTPEQNCPDGVGYVVVDLGKEYDITDIKLHVYDEDGGATDISAVTASVSVDGTNYSGNYALSGKGGESKTYWMAADATGAKARYVKLKVEVATGTYTYWGLFNEVEVYGMTDAGSANQGGSNNSNTTNNGNSSNTPSAGDASNVIAFAILGVVAIAGSAVVIKTRR